VLELNYTNINKAMNISVQSVLRGLEKGEGEFRRREWVLADFLNNGDTGATSPRPLFTSKKPRQQSHKAPGEQQGNHKISNRYGAAI
jgi:hypothetical protein